MPFLELNNMSLLITDGSEPLTTADVKAWAKIEKTAMKTH